MLRSTISSIFVALCIAVLSFACAEESQQSGGGSSAADEVQLQAAHIVYYAIPG